MYTAKVSCCYMKSLNITKTLIFSLLCVLCFQTIIDFIDFTAAGVKCHAAVINYDNKSSHISL